MLRPKSIFPILLALSFLFSKAQGTWHLGQLHRREAIGYVAVPEEVALRINKDNTIFTRESSLGPGFSLINEPGVGQDWSWYCVVEAKWRKMKNIDKIYIPQSIDKWTTRGSQRRNLWGGSEENILDYIRSKPLKSEPEKALRFSWFQNMGSEWRQQMVIPEYTILHGDLGLWAKCYEAQPKLMAYSDKYIDWETGEIEGERGPRPPRTSR
ncbi:hypothetical protein LZ554_005995 [Drepanopeziza brunnea f. sp. 'monogermtubi']|nr:hypothetical protein LZ554_005995 [Drepanopeziza brunnea f. sp. 'monogermtubi']